MLLLPVAYTLTCCMLTPNIFITVFFSLPSVITLKEEPITYLCFSCSASLWCIYRSITNIDFDNHKLGLWPIHLYDLYTSIYGTYGAHLQAENWKVHNYLYSFFVILPWSHDLENVTSCWVSQGVHSTPSTRSITPCYWPTLDLRQGVYVV